MYETAVGCTHRSPLPSQLAWDTCVIFTAKPNPISPIYRHQKFLLGFSAITDLYFNNGSVLLPLPHSRPMRCRVTVRCPSGRFLCLLYHYFRQIRLYLYYMYCDFFLARCLTICHQYRVGYTKFCWRAVKIILKWMFALYGRPIIYDPTHTFGVKLATFYRFWSNYVDWPRTIDIPKDLGIMLSEKWNSQARSQDNSVSWT